MNVDFFVSRLEGGRRRIETTRLLSARFFLFVVLCALLFNDPHLFLLFRLLARFYTVKRGWYSETSLALFPSLARSIQRARLFGAGSKAKQLVSFLASVPNRFTAHLLVKSRPFLLAQRSIQREKAKAQRALRELIHDQLVASFVGSAHLPPLRSSVPSLAQLHSPPSSSSFNPTVTINSTLEGQDRRSPS